MVPSQKRSHCSADYAKVNMYASYAYLINFTTLKTLYMRSVRLVLFLSGVFLLASYFSFGQEASRKYDSLWIQVDQLVDVQGLPKSALAVVNKIYVLAKKERREDQLIKSLVYRINLSAAGKEDANVSSIKELEKEVLGATGTAKAILTSILAQAYWDYFQSVRYELYDRTATVNFKKEDLATWGASDFHAYITKLYESSISEDAVLKKVKTDTYKAIIEKGTARKLRPTL